MSETTLVALRTDTGERVTISDLPLESLRALSDRQLLRCPQCNGLLMLKAGTVRVHHFAHTSLADCNAFDHEPESDSHRQGKLLLYNTFRQEALAATLEQHLPATDQRADVFIQTQDKLRYALEFQQANNSTSRWLERHRLYRSIGVFDLWFLGQLRYQERHLEAPISPYDPLPVPRHEFDAGSGSFSVRELEKAILTTEPQLYYLDPDSSLLTILLARDLHRNTLRAYRYRLPLSACLLRDGQLWTPLDPLLEDYQRYRAEHLR
ncbi:MAG: competence protein CoiA family protein [Chloroflexota bacterium]